MKLLPVFAFSLAAAFAAAPGSASAAQAAPAVHVKPASLPVAPDPAFSFRKIISQTYDQELEGKRSKSRKRVDNPYIDFEKRRLIRGAITPEDFRQKQGSYYSFYWKAKRDASVTVRFEYRQANLGAHVQALAVDYPSAKGSHRTQFAVAGDDYLNDGRVIAWRASIIENGRIVATTQSYLWR